MKQRLTAFLVITSLTLSAQTKTLNVKPSPLIVTDIEKVAMDYYNHFDQIKGEEIYETPNIIEYASKINPPGALESTIMQIKSLDNAYSWQALMLDTENYYEAVAKYKLIYRQLFGAKIALGEGKSFKLKGSYDAPDEARSFASSMLSIESPDAKYGQFKIEIALTYSMPEWSVKLYVYEKESDEEIRPTANSDY